LEIFAEALDAVADVAPQVFGQGAKLLDGGLADAEAVFYRALFLLSFWGFARLSVGGFFEAGAGMTGTVDLLELLDAHLGVNLGGGQFGVAEELLDEADVGSVF
jgi:hypothetical protein